MESFTPGPPPLFNRFRERRTASQRKRLVIRAASLVRQQVLAIGADLKRRLTR
jgi:hypothetical protein